MVCAEALENWDLEGGLVFSLCISGVLPDKTDCIHQPSPPQRSQCFYLKQTRWHWMNLFWASVSSHTCSPWALILSFFKKRWLMPPPLFVCQRLSFKIISFQTYTLHAERKDCMTTVATCCCRSIPWPEQRKTENNYKLSITDHIFCLPSEVFLLIGSVIVAPFCSTLWEIPSILTAFRGKCPSSISPPLRRSKDKAKLQRMSAVQSGVTRFYKSVLYMSVKLSHNTKQGRKVLLPFFLFLLCKSSNLF